MTTTSPAPFVALQLLMANGTSEPISQTDDGDRILATTTPTAGSSTPARSPASGCTPSPSSTGRSTALLHLHRSPPIWHATDQAWERGDPLDIGDLVTTADAAPPRARGGNATLDNAQVACEALQSVKGAPDRPVSPPPGYRGACLR